jgi:hypothetical protein
MSVGGGVSVAVRAWVGSRRVAVSAGTGVSAVRGIAD